MEVMVPTAEEIEQAKQHIEHSLVDVPDGHGGTMPLMVICRANTGEDVRVGHVQVNIQRKVPRFLNRPDLMMRRDKPIAICGGGPSLKRHLDEIRKFEWVMAAGSSHDFLVDNGICPSFSVFSDSREETVNYLKNINPFTHYIVASTCHPKVFDHIGGCQIYMWHFNEQVEEKLYQGEPSCGWGCMVGVVCIQHALRLGFQEHHYFGYDCCFEDTDTHSYQVADWEKKGLLEDRTLARQGPAQVPFWTTTALICQITHFYGVYRCPDGNFLKGYVYGPGMLWDNIRQSPPEMKQWLEAV